MSNSPDYSVHTPENETQQRHKANLYYDPTITATSSSCSYSAGPLAGVHEQSQQERASQPLPGGMDCLPPTTNQAFISNIVSEPSTPGAALDDAYDKVMRRHKAISAISIHTDEIISQRRNQEKLQQTIAPYPSASRKRVTTSPATTSGAAIAVGNNVHSFISVGNLIYIGKEEKGWKGSLLTANENGTSSLMEILGEGEMRAKEAVEILKYDRVGPGKKDLKDKSAQDVLIDHEKAVQEDELSLDVNAPGAGTNSQGRVAPELNAHKRQEAEDQNRAVPWTNVQEKRRRYTETQNLAVQNNEVNKRSAGGTLTENRGLGDAGDESNSSHVTGEGVISVETSHSNDSVNVLKNGRRMPVWKISKYFFIASLILAPFWTTLYYFSHLPRRPILTHASYDHELISLNSTPYDQLRHLIVPLSLIRTGVNANLELLLSYEASLASSVELTPFLPPVYKSLDILGVHLRYLLLPVARQPPLLALHLITATDYHARRSLSSLRRLRTSAAVTTFHANAPLLVRYFLTPPRWNESDSLHDHVESKVQDFANAVFGPATQLLEAARTLQCGLVVAVEMIRQARVELRSMNSRLNDTEVTLRRGINMHRKQKAEELLELEIETGASYFESDAPSPGSQKHNNTVGVGARIYNWLTTAEGLSRASSDRRSPPLPRSPTNTSIHSSTSTLLSTATPLQSLPSSRPSTHANTNHSDPAETDYQFRLAAITDAVQKIRDTAVWLIDVEPTWDLKYRPAVEEYVQILECLVLELYVLSSPGTQYWGSSGVAKDEWFREIGGDQFDWSNDKVGRPKLKQETSKLASMGRNDTKWTTCERYPRMMASTMMTAAPGKTQDKYQDYENVARLKVLRIALMVRYLWF